MGDQSYGIDVKTVSRIAEEIKGIHEKGIEVCMVVGGGNIFRGVIGADYGMPRSAADSIGMLATIMNALAFQSSLEQQGMKTRVMSAVAMPAICEAYIRRKAMRHLEKGRVVICAAGSGNPYFTTDTAAILRALELECELLIKATKVAGVYDSDPKTNPYAVFFSQLSYRDVIEKNLKVMDKTAIVMAQENNMPILVCSLETEGNMEKVLFGEGVCSIIS
jgi:uridylate kinase